LFGIAGGAGATALCAIFIRQRSRKRARIYALSLEEEAKAREDMRSQVDDFGYSDGMLPAAWSAVGTHVQEEYRRLTNALMTAREREAAFGVPMYRPQSADKRRAERRADLLSVALRQLFSSLDLDLETAFKFFDEDENGSVSADEFREGLARLNIELPDRKFEDLVRSVDSDGDGSIDLREFFVRFIAKPDPTGTAVALTPGQVCHHAALLSRPSCVCALISLRISQRPGAHSLWIIHCSRVCARTVAVASQVASPARSGAKEYTGATTRRKVLSASISDWAVG